MATQVLINCIVGVTSIFICSSSSSSIIHSSFRAPSTQYAAKKPKRLSPQALLPLPSPTATATATAAARTVRLQLALLMLQRRRRGIEMAGRAAAAAM